MQAYDIFQPLLSFPFRFILQIFWHIQSGLFFACFQLFGIFGEITDLTNDLQTTHNWFGIHNHFVEDLAYFWVV